MGCYKRYFNIFFDGKFDHPFYLMLTEGGSISDTLQEVTVPIMSNAQCRKTGYGEKRITDNMLCAGIPEGGKDSCQVKLIRRSICGYLY